jgi:chloride channel 7
MRGLSAVRSSLSSTHACGKSEKLPSWLLGIESLDYDIRESSVFHRELQEQGPRSRTLRKVAQWGVCAAIGCTTGIVAFLVDFIGVWVVKGKQRAAATGDSWAQTAAIYVAVSAALVAVSAALVVWVSPVAGGSGISEVKAYLQGVRVPMLLRTTTLVAKMVGVLCSVSGGLLVGKEGPMIHAGAIIAAGVSQGSSKTCNIKTPFLKRFRNDHDKV